MQHKRQLRLVGVLVIVLAFGSLLADDSTLKQLQDRGYVISSGQDTISEVTSLTKLHNWFTCKDFERHRNNIQMAPYATSPDLLIPIGIYPIKKDIDLKSLWELKLEYASHLQTANVGVGWHRKLGDSWFISPFAMLGAGNSDVEGLGARIQLNIEGGAEVGYYLGRRFALVAGGLYSWVDPFAVATGTGISIFGGGRYFFTRQNQISLNLQAGQHFWSGFAGSMPPNFYVSGGFSLYRSASMAKVIGSHVRPLEFGVLASSALATANAKIGLPFALRKELSIAPFASYGIKTGYAGIRNQNLANSISVGLELRLFGSQLDKFVNPYIGAQKLWINYDANPAIPTVSNQTSGWGTYLGTRIKVYQNIALDVNMGPAFWSNNFPAGNPDDIMVSGGLFVTLGKKGKVDELNLHGIVMTKKLNSLEHIPTLENCNPLSEDMLEQYDGEIRTYVYREAESTIFGNLTDLAFVDYFGMSVKIQKVENTYRDVNVIREHKIDKVVQESPKKVVVMFDNKKINIEKLKRAELYLCFSNYSNNRYFGFYKDDKGILQPEYITDLALGAKVVDRKNPQQDYMGSFDEFVKPLAWIDGSFSENGILGSDIKEAVTEKFMEDNGLDVNDAALKQQLLGQYDFAYAVCENQLTNKINEYLKSDDLGYSVLAARDFNNDKLVKPDPDHAGRLIFDSKDDFVFSNHEKIIGREKIDRCSDLLVLTDFEECESTLTDEHLQKLAKLQESIVNAQEVTIIGYADLSNPTPDCLRAHPGGNAEIAMARAVSVKDYLVKNFGIDPSIVTASGCAAEANNLKCPKCRKVFVHITNPSAIEQMSSLE